MPIKYPVVPRTILLCDYQTGFREPEMVKKRPAIVISPRLPHRDNLCAVVPLSTTPPAHVVPYVVEVRLTPCLPSPFDFPLCWAKCDMIATVSFERLDLFRTGRDPSGKRMYLHPKLDEKTFFAVMQGVLYGLGLSHLTLPSSEPHSP